MQLNSIILIYLRVSNEIYHRFGICNMWIVPSDFTAAYASQCFVGCHATVFVDPNIQGLYQHIPDAIANPGKQEAHLHMCQHFPGIAQFQHASMVVMCVIRRVTSIWISQTRLADQTYNMYRPFWTRHRQQFTIVRKSKGLYSLTDIKTTLLESWPERQ